MGYADSRSSGAGGCAEWRCVAVCGGVWWCVAVSGVSSVRKLSHLGDQSIHGLCNRRGCG